MAVQEHPVSNGNHTQSDIPPFPDDVPTAPLICLSLKKLQEWDPLESKSFFRSCKELGFFYLNLEDCEEGRTLLQQADQLFGFGERLFDDDLTDYDFSDQYSYFGYYRVAPCSYETGHMPLNIELTDASYKGFGTSVIDKDGTRDRNEFYNVYSLCLPHAHIPLTKYTL